MPTNQNETKGHLYVWYEGPKTFQKIRLEKKAREFSIEENKIAGTFFAKKDGTSLAVKMI